MRDLATLKEEYIDVENRLHNFRQDITIRQRLGDEVPPSEFAYIGLLATRSISLKLEIDRASS
jgi:hypothetical protein